MAVQNEDIDLYWSFHPTSLKWYPKYSGVRYLFDLLQFWLTTYSYWLSFKDNFFINLVLSKGSTIVASKKHHCHKLCSPDWFLNKIFNISGIRQEPYLVAVHCSCLIILVQTKMSQILWIWSIWNMVIFCSFICWHGWYKRERNLYSLPCIPWWQKQINLILQYVIQCIVRRILFPLR